MNINRAVFTGLIGILITTYSLVVAYEQQIAESWMRFRLRNENIVVSLTTTPHRINHIAYNIERLFQQNVHVEHVYLSVPYIFKRDNLEYKIPPWLRDNAKITILRTKDYGPGTKLLGALSQVKFAPNTIIIVVDDDVIYPKNLILNLAYTALINSNSAVGMMGAEPIYDETGNIDLNSQYGLRRISSEKSAVKILQGWAGIAYRAGFFDAEVFEIENTIDECKNSDDVYLSYYLAARNIPRLVFKNKWLVPEMINKESPLANSADALFKQTPGPTLKHRACFAYLHAKNSNVDF